MTLHLFFLTITFTKRQMSLKELRHQERIGRRIDEMKSSRVFPNRLY